MHIGSLDLNLLRVFDAVYRQKSVSRAAESLSLSQPAVSQSIARLRLLLKDALFIRVAGGVMPTAGAQTLARHVREALLLLEQGLHATARFDPNESRRTFRIHMSDIGEAEFLPALMQRVRRDAPGVRIETQQLDYRDIENALDSGKIDFAFGYLPDVEQTERQRLFLERYVVLARADHPRLTARPSPVAPDPAEHAAFHGHPGDRRRDRSRRRPAAAHRGQVRARRRLSHRPAALGAGRLRHRAALEPACRKRPGRPLAARAGHRAVPGACPPGGHETLIRRH